MTNELAGLRQTQEYWIRQLELAHARAVTEEGNKNIAWYEQELRIVNDEIAALPVAK